MFILYTRASKNGHTAIKQMGLARSRKAHRYMLCAPLFNHLTLKVLLSTSGLSSNFSTVMTIGTGITPESVHLNGK